jgi:arginine decarboxylase
VEGDTVADVLTYVEFDPKVLVTRFRDFAEKAVTEGRISPKERREILNRFREGLAGYAYFES